MTITFSAILLGLLAFFRPLQKNSFYMLHCAIVILSAYYIEQNIFRCTPFASKTFLLFVIFQLVSINVVTIWAYYWDKRAARKGNWRVPESVLHTLELLGGWSGAFVAQRLFRHKTKKQSYQSTFWMVVAFEIALVYFILKFILA